jgi:hypothetical protein
MGDWAFSGCKGLTNLTVPSGITASHDDHLLWTGQGASCGWSSKIEWYEDMGSFAGGP